MKTDLALRTTAFKQGRHLLIPEVIQTSSMDGGPATPRGLLGGWGMQVGAGRLREACQAELDGTSSDRLDEIARQLLEHDCLRWRFTNGRCTPGNDAPARLCGLHQVDAAQAARAVGCAGCALNPFASARVRCQIFCG